MGQFFVLFILMQARSFSPMSEFTGLSIEAKCEPVKKDKRAHEKRTSKPVKSLYGVGRYTVGFLPKIPFKLTQSIYVTLQKSWNLN